MEREEGHSWVSSHQPDGGVSYWLQDQRWMLPWVPPAKGPARASGSPYLGVTPLRGGDCLCFPSLCLAFGRYLRGPPDQCPCVLANGPGAQDGKEEWPPLSGSGMRWECELLVPVALASLGSPPSRPGGAGLLSTRTQLAIAESPLAIQASPCPAGVSSKVTARPLSPQSPGVKAWVPQQLPLPRRAEMVGAGGRGSCPAVSSAAAGPPLALLPVAARDSERGRAGAGKRGSPAAAQEPSLGSLRLPPAFTGS